MLKPLLGAPPSPPGPPPWPPPAPAPPLWVSPPGTPPAPFCVSAPPPTICPIAAPGPVFCVQHRRDFDESAAQARRSAARAQRSGSVQNPDRRAPAAVVEPGHERIWPVL